MKFNIKNNEEKFENIAGAMKLKKKNGKAVVKHLFDLNKKIGLPKKLAKVGVKDEHIETLSDLAIADFAHPNNPKPVTRDDFKNLYLEAL